MQIIHFIAVSLVLVILLPSVSMASECSSGRPSVSVKPVIKPTKYIRGQSAKSLTQMHGVSGSADSRVLGLGGGEMGLNARAEFEIVQRGKKACVSLKSIKTTFYAYPQIHIANNFRRGGCEYSSVLAHEQKHVRTLRLFHREYTPKLRMKLKKLARKIGSSGSIPASQISRVQQDMNDEITEMIHDYSARIGPILEKRQLAIDSKAEYARVNAKCKKWDEKLYDSEEY